MNENDKLDQNTADLPDDESFEDQSEITDELEHDAQDFVEEDFVPEDERTDDIGISMQEQSVLADDLAPLPLADDLDIDAALASVADLGDVLAERDAAELAERERIEAERRAAEEEAKRRAEHYFPRPSLVEIERGQMASVVPALLLIALGAWWTFALTTLETPPSTGEMLLMSMGVFGIIMIAYWLFSGRWSSGALFAGVTSLVGAGTIFLLNEGIADGGYALLFVAPAVGLLATAVLSARAGQRVGFTGVLLLVVAVAAYMVTNNLIAGDNLTDIARLLLPFVGVALLVILALPVVFRRQR